MSKRYCFGYEAELSVAKDYEERDYSVIAQRYKTKYGEIDLIAVKGKMVAFIEVKARRNNVFQNCLEPKQIKRNIAAAKAFLNLNPQYSDMELRYDLALVKRDKIIEEIIEGAILDDHI